MTTESDILRRLGAALATLPPEEVLYIADRRRLLQQVFNEAALAAGHKIGLREELADLRRQLAAAREELVKAERDLPAARRAKYVSEWDRDRTVTEALRLVQQREQGVRELERVTATIEAQLAISTAVVPA